VVNFKGIDMHNVRELYGPEQSGLGDGAMIEAVLDYQLSDMWDVGLGGRYWMWNMHNGSVLFDFLGESPDISEPARFNMARYGLFLQVSYRHRQTQPANEWHDPFDWQGVYVGGHMGGAWGQSEWTDPFGSTAAGAGFVNVAGFGDNIRSTGPLGGMNFNINWQKNLLVYGVGASFSAADVRGENTLYSGLGGVNGQTIINYLGTLVARIGVADDRSLLYVNVGRAVLNTQYNLNGNTGVLLLGSQSETQSNWGWTSGIGVEHALTDHWTTSVEYDYVYIPYHTVSFPSVAILNTQQLTANQAMNLFKVGLNYKF
jgi:outer membrane immunogenic protein